MEHPTQSESIFNEKFSNITTKVLLGAITVIFTIAGMMYSDVKQRTDALEDRVSFLYQDKISRDEFRMEFIELKKEMASSRMETNAKVEAMKREIIERIDLFMQLQQEKSRAKLPQ